MARRPLCVLTCLNLIWCRTGTVGLTKDERISLKFPTGVSVRGKVRVRVRAKAELGVGLRRRLGLRVGVRAGWVG